MQSNLGPSAPALVPAKEPAELVKLDPNYRGETPYVAGVAAPSTEGVAGAPHDTRVSIWLSRFNHWRDGFQQHISPRTVYCWRLWRNFSDKKFHGPNQDWRNTTEIPEPFKIVENRAPRIFTNMFGAETYFQVEGRSAMAEDFEDMVSTLLETKIEEIGRNERDAGNFFTRTMDGIRYCQIMGHVWWYLGWKEEWAWQKVRIPNPGPDGKITWTWEEVLHQTFAGLDFRWVPLDSLAVPLGANNRPWAIERIQTSKQGLERENAIHFKRTGQPLYQNLHLVTGGGTLKEEYEEPKSTERWPYDDSKMNLGMDPMDEPVELWLCWDNRRRTLTKIANRSVVLAEGAAPTPDGLDPYWNTKAVPVPGQVYGDSILSWVGPLCEYQSLLAQARADEVLLGVWQQYIVKNRAVTNGQFLFKPGGSIEVEIDNDRPVRDVIDVLPRRPVMQQAWTEDGYRQQQAESTAGTDALSQGVEATQKSRDVTAREVDVRAAYSNLRNQAEGLYWEVTFKQPCYQRAINLLKVHLTEEQTIRILSPDGTTTPRQVSLMDLQVPIDIKVGGGFFEISKQAKLGSLNAAIGMMNNERLAQFLKPQPIITEVFKLMGWKRPERFAMSEEEVNAERQQKQQEQMAMEAALQAAQGGGAAGGPALPPEPGPGTVPGPGGGEPPEVPGGPAALVEDLL